LLIAAACVRAREGRLAMVATRARPALLVLACLALAVLPVPVMITTATALETECFVLVHFHALGLLVESLRAPPPP
jgi:hypothetical protein